jgi:poly-gamma-glutamate synthesis protein (capsule biosynthesis protein)
MNRISSILLLSIFLIACAASTSTPIPAAATLEVAPTATQTPMPDALWVGPAVPDELREYAKLTGLPMVTIPEIATQKLDISNSGSLWIYALVSPFPTVTDGVSSADLISAWQSGSSLTGNGQPILMAESTLSALTVLWGEPASGAVRTVSKEQILDAAWIQPFSPAIIPFEEIQPKWKVLTVDGQSPIRKDFVSDSYPLKATFGLTNASFELPASNRDASKLTTVVLTGVTALVRATAFTMETKGVTRPGELIHDWLANADIAHISNEVPFDPDCPPPTPGYKNFILCSDPKYFELLQYVGVDIVELTGDHFADRGTQAMLDTLKIYRDNNIPYYGGGANVNEARKPVFLEVNGNKIAFMGCNGKVTYTIVKATDIQPGAADCDYAFFTNQVKDAVSKGYIVIFTFQHEECYHSGPCYKHDEGFHAVADAGATVVSGSQAHYPHLMEFRGNSFIHFGLGNLFFDQMTYELPDGSIIDGTRREFIDRHVLYDGKYLGVELLTAMLEDFSRPRPMNERERAQFLSEYFAYSGWTESQPAPIPVPTVTLTPIVLPSP